MTTENTLGLCKFDIHQNTSESGEVFLAKVTAQAIEYINSHAGLLPLWVMNLQLPGGKLWDLLGPRITGEMEKGDPVDVSTLVDVPAYEIGFNIKSPNKILYPGVQGLLFGHPQNNLELSRAWHSSLVDYFETNAPEEINALSFYPLYDPKFSAAYFESPCNQEIYDLLVIMEVQTNTRSYIPVLKSQGSGNDYILPQLVRFMVTNKGVYKMGELYKIQVNSSLSRVENLRLKKLLNNPPLDFTLVQIDREKDHYAHFPQIDIAQSTELLWKQAVARHPTESNPGTFNILHLKNYTLYIPSNTLQAEIGALTRMLIVKPNDGSDEIIVVQMAEHYIKLLEIIAENGFVNADTSRTLWNSSNRNPGINQAIGRIKTYFRNVSLASPIKSVPSKSIIGINGLSVDYVLDRIE